MALGDDCSGTNEDINAEDEEILPTVALRHNDDSMDDCWWGCWLFWSLLILTLPLPAADLLPIAADPFNWRNAILALEVAPETLLQLDIIVTIMVIMKQMRHENFDDDDDGFVLCRDENKEMTSIGQNYKSSA